MPRCSIRLCCGKELIFQQVCVRVSFIVSPLIVLQVDYLKSRQLGGAAVWTLDMDDFSGQFCGQGKYPLISHLKRKLSEGEATVACTIINVSSSHVLFYDSFASCYKLPALLVNQNSYYCSIGWALYCIPCP